MIVTAGGVSKSRLENPIHFPVRFLTTRSVLITGNAWSF